MIVRKIKNFCCIDPIPLISFVDEPPADQHNDDFFWLQTQTLIAGDLSFFATILGGGEICWALGAHGACFPRHSGMILHICQASYGQLTIYMGSAKNVVENGMLEIPENIKGCMDKPLFNSVCISYNHRNWNWKCSG